MKLLSILISSALVGHVLVIELNEEIKQAIEFMPEIIKRIVEKSDEYWMEAMAFMLSVPEVLDVKLGPESDSDSDENIVGTLEGPGPSQSQIPNLNLDPSTISKEGPSQNQIPDLNIDPSTAPEEDINNPNFVRKTIIQLEEKLEYQKMMRLAILAVTDRSKYEELLQSEIRRATTDTIPIHSIDLNRPPASDKRRIEAPKIKLENLASVLEQRRMHPTAVPKKRIIRAFGLTSLGRARREMTLEAITLLIRQHYPVFHDLFNMCRLAGLYRTIKYPRTYIDYTLVDQTYCYLTDVLGVEDFLYKFHNGEFWKVDVNNLALIKPFLLELLE